MLRVTDEAIAELQAAQPVRGSAEWYALNNLEEFRARVMNSVDLAGIDGARRNLARFIADSTDWGSPLMHLLGKVVDEAHRVVAGVGFNS